MKEKTQKLINRLVKKWDMARSFQNTELAKRIDIFDEYETILGTFPWNNEKLVMLFCEVGGGSYYGVATLIGLTREGKLVWEYQSHCSCNSFEDSSYEGTELKHEHILEKKTYELNSLPVDWEEQIQNNIEKLLKALLATQKEKIESSPEL